MQAAIHHAIVSLRKANSVVVCAHVRPDGDAVGSTLAMTLALREVGIPAIPTLASGLPAPTTYDWLPGFGLFVSADQLEAPDVFVALDTPNADRLGEGEALMRAAGQVIVIDHHPDAKELGTINMIDPAAPATAELVWQFATALLEKSNADIALCCYVGLITDTGRFSYDNTCVRAFSAAAEMLDAGVNAAEAARLTYQNRSRASLAIEARAMSRLTLANDGRVAYAWVNDADFTELGAQPEEAESLPDAVRLLGGIEVALLVRQHGPEVRVNLRAKTGFDVGAVARHFGGGGHKAAAGCTLNGKVADLMPSILALLPGGDAA